MLGHHAISALPISGFGFIYEEVASGGVVCSGMGETPAHYVEVASGGCVVGGAGTLTGVTHETANGGAVVGGTGIVFVVGEPEIATGAAVVGGSATVSKRTAVTASGGVVCSGAGQVHRIIPIVGTGGVRAGGLGRNTYRASGHVAFGCEATMTCDGRVIQGSFAEITGECNMTVTGIVINRPAASGGVVAGGTASQPVIHRITSTGGAVTGGAGDVAEVIHGAVDFDCEANMTCDGQVITQGSGAVCGGTGIVTCVYRNVGSGGVVLGGRQPIDGAVVFDCSANMTVTGDVLTGSAVSFDCEASLQATGNVRNNPTTSGGSVAGGASVVSAVYKQVSSGGVTVGSTDEFGVSFTGECNMSVTGTVINAPAASGGVVAGGAGDTRLIFRHTAAGGVICGSAETFGVSFNCSANMSVTGNVIAAASCSIHGSIQLSILGHRIATGSVHFDCEANMTVHVLTVPKPLMLELHNFLSQELATPNYPIRFPQMATFPCVSFFRVSSIPEYDLDGAIGVSRTRLQVDVWARRYSEIKGIDREMRLLLNGFSDFMGSVEIFDCALDGVADVPEPPDEGADSGLCHRAIDYMFLHTTNAPALV